MPNIILKIPEGVFTTGQVSQIVKGVTGAAHEAESIPDDPKHHILTWVVVEELKPSNVFVGGNPVIPHQVPIIALIYPPEGVLDDERRAVQSKRIYEAICDAADEMADRVQVSCIMLDVPERAWGGNGSILTLETISQIAGYQHKPTLDGAAR